MVKIEAIVAACRTDTDRAGALLVLAVMFLR